jgi:tetratricopeptide (TPR) repeat protein
MRLGIFLFAGSLLWGQTRDPGLDPLDQAYKALRQKDYDAAIASFRTGLERLPTHVAAHKDLAYTYLKTGDSRSALEEFRRAAELDPADFHVALEYAFLAFESTDEPAASKAEARRIFDRVRKAGDPVSRATAEQAFRNIDRALETQIARWLESLKRAPGTFSTHYELASLAEQRDQLDLAAEHYMQAWRMPPHRRSVLLDIARVRRNQGRADDAIAALLAASRGGEPRSAELARARLPHRYPFVYEFRKALELDPANTTLRRELAYLLLAMRRQPDAEREFRLLTQGDGKDLLSAAQLGFLLLARKNQQDAMPLLQTVLNGNDAELANRVRAVLQLPQIAVKPDPASEARLMAERSYKAGYLKDALKYYTAAHELDPSDAGVVLRLGWISNMLHDDAGALRWFGLARNSADPATAAEARRAYRGLWPQFARVRTSAWMLPMYSSRWHDVFSYGQAKAELKLGSLPFRPYASLRFVGDTQRAVGVGVPTYLSESSFIAAIGVASRYWRGAMLWGEAGSAISYRSRPVHGRMLPDYRGGLSFGRGFGHGIGSERPGWFTELTADAVFISRFGNDGLFYPQWRAGYTPHAVFGVKSQVYWNANLTADTARQYWANFVETGPGVRLRCAGLPSGLSFSLNLLGGAYTRNEGNPRRPSFYDVRAGFWYAITR